MKDYEKANEIASLFVIENVSTENELIIRKMLNKSAMEMAKWKGEQIFTALKQLGYDAALVAVKQLINTDDTKE